jgi:hypothetical protein
MFLIVDIIAQSIGNCSSCRREHQDSGEERPVSDAADETTEEHISDAYGAENAPAQLEKDWYLRHCRSIDIKRTDE